MPVPVPVPVPVPGPVPVPVPVPVAVPVPLPVHVHVPVPVPALKWFKSYLSEMKQTVRIKNETPKPEKLIFGVLQGSVLGHILFLSYTLPLADILKDHYVQYHLC